MTFDPTNLPEESLLTTSEVAELLRLSPGRLRNLRCEGRAPRGVKIGRSVRFSLRDVRAWLAAHVEAEPEPTNSEA